MHGADGESALGEVIADPLGLALRPGEDHDEAASVGLQDAGEDFDFVHGMRAPNVLLDGVDDGAIVTRLTRAQVDRLGHVSAGEIDDLAGHGCGEQHCLPFRGDFRDYALDVGQETHVEHFICFVKHQGANPGEHEVAPIY